MRRSWRAIRLYCLCAGLFAAGYLSGLLQGRCGAGPDTAPKERPHTAFLAVAVFSAPGNAERRAAIRRTWLQSGSGRGVLHKFVVGRDPRVEELRAEQEEHGDLLILDSIRDSFSELSRKLLETIRWMDANVDFQFLLKVDDDSFARLDALVDRLGGMGRKGARLYWGFFDGRASVKRRGKWAERYWFLCDRYLPYAKGGGYVLSRDLVGVVAGLGARLSLYRNEDVSMGVWLAPLAGVERLHDPDFDTEYAPRGCYNSYLVTHKQSPAMMEEKWRALRAHGRMCGASEYRARNSYVYDWGVPPSQCCNRSDPSVP